MKKNNLNDLINKAKANNQKKTIQKVTPVLRNNKEEVQFSFYLPKNLLKNIKRKALDEDESIKSVICKALEKYLN